MQLTERCRRWPLILTDVKNVEESAAGLNHWNPVEGACPYRSSWILKGKTNTREVESKSRTFVLPLNV